VAEPAAPVARVSANAEAGTTSTVTAMITCTERIQRSFNMDLKPRTS
jgi:hypothetical protein